MRTKEFPGGWYCDALPSGEYAVVVATQGIVKTHLGDLRHPDGWVPLYVRVTNKNLGFEFAGQSNSSLSTLHYSDGKWSDIPKTPCGMNPVIFDNFGNLTISNCSVGVRGYRYCDYYSNVLVSGDNTGYYPPAGIFEWSDLGDGLFIGQGGMGDAHLWDGKVSRLLYKGAPYTIKFNRVGEDVAISLYLGPQNLPPTSVIIWATMTELRNLPIVPVVIEVPSVSVQPQPPVVPTPVPVPVIVPEPITVKPEPIIVKPEPIEVKPVIEEPVRPAESPIPVIIHKKDSNVGVKTTVGIAVGVGIFSWLRNKFKRRKKDNKDAHQ